MHGQVGKSKRNYLSHKESKVLEESTQRVISTKPSVNFRNLEILIFLDKIRDSRRAGIPFWGLHLQ